MYEPKEVKSDVYLLQLGFEHEKENVENILDTNQHNAGNVLQGNQQLNVGDFINIGNDDALRHADGFLENPMYMVNVSIEFYTWCNVLSC